VWGKSELFEKELILLLNGQGKAGRESGGHGSHISGRSCGHIDGRDQSRGQDGCIQRRQWCRVHSKISLTGGPHTCS